MCFLIVITSFAEVLINVRVTFNGNDYLLSFVNYEPTASIDEHIQLELQPNMKAEN
jgi:hypothetical protein